VVFLPDTLIQLEELYCEPNSLLFGIPDSFKKMKKFNDNDYGDYPTMQWYLNFAKNN